MSLWLAVGAVTAAASSYRGPNHHTETLSQDDLAAGLANGQLALDTVRRMGMRIFVTPFDVHDGFGDGPFDPNEIDTLVPGHRPTLQGNGTLLRVNGLDAQACNECHTIVRHDTVPPTLGIGGVGGMVQNAIILPSRIDVADEDFDGEAEFNGRFANPPFLFGGGGVELLAKEMTADLQDALRFARTLSPGAEVPLRTKGVSFGRLIVGPNGEIDTSQVEGIGFVDNAQHEPEDVLVVRPFGRKGENFSMRDFDRGAMQFHFGIQPVEVVGQGIDEDGDGQVDEITVGEMTALHVFDVTNPRPVQARPDVQSRRGARLFRDIGCVNCHRPVLTTRSNRIPLAYPEVPQDPSANVYAWIDLRKAGFESAAQGGVRVPLFADLKRHKMGERLAENFARGQIPNDEFTTARLWGVADTAPYLHDGRATTLFDAIEFHGGEAQEERDSFMNLAADDQEALIAFLLTLRTPDAPNEELVE